MIGKIILSYVKKQIESLGLRKSQEWLLITVVFKGQWTPAVKKKWLIWTEKLVPVPNNMINNFQTLNLTGNWSGKAHLRKSTQKWVSSEVQRQLEKGKQPENIKIDTRLSVTKPLHTKWITSSYDYMQSNGQTVLNSLEKSDITKFLKIDAALKCEDVFNAIEIQLE